MSFDSAVFPWEVLVLLSFFGAILMVISLVRWVFRKGYKRRPTKRILFAVLCLAGIFLPFQLIDDFGARMRYGLQTNAASTSDSPIFAELRTPHYNLPADYVYAQALETAKSQRGWNVTADSGTNRVIGVRINILLGIFKDEMGIAVVDEGDSTRVDVQSKSLVGRSDLGANRRHVAQFLTALDERLRTAQP